MSSLALLSKSGGYKTLCPSEFCKFCEFCEFCEFWELTKFAKLTKLTELAELAELTELAELAEEAAPSVFIKEYTVYDVKVHCSRQNCSPNMFT